MSVHRTIVYALAVLLLFSLAPGCSKTEPTKRIRLYMPKEEAKPKVTTAKKNKRRRGPKLYEAPGRLLSSGLKINGFLVPKGLKRQGKSANIVLAANLPLKDLAGFFKSRTDEYVVLDQPHGFKVLSKKELGSKKTSDYDGPKLYINRNDRGEARMVFFEGNRVVKTTPKNQTGSTTGTQTGSNSGTKTGTKPKTIAKTGSNHPKPDIPIAPTSMVPSSMKKNPGTYTVVPNRPRPLDYTKMPVSLQNKIKQWQADNPGQKFDM